MVSNMSIVMTISPQQYISPVKNRGIPMDSMDRVYPVLVDEMVHQCGHLYAGGEVILCGTKIVLFELKITVRGGLRK